MICSQWITTFVTWISLFITTYNVFPLHVTPSPFPLLLFHPRSSYILFHASLLLRNNLLLNISECKLNKLHAQTPVVSCPMCVQITRRSAESLESYFAPLLKPHLKQLRLLPIIDRIKCKFNLNHPQGIHRNSSDCIVLLLCRPPTTNYPITRTSITFLLETTISPIHVLVCLQCPPLTTGTIYLLLWLHRNSCSPYTIKSNN